MDSPINADVIKKLKNYINNNFKMIGFDYKTTGDVFTSALDDFIVIKILCKMGKCQQVMNCKCCNFCNCERVVQFFNSFGLKYDCYIEQQKISVNGHFEFHQITIFVKKDSKY